MQITKTELDDAINGIVAFHNRQSKTATSNRDFIQLQNKYADHLDGLAFLFVDHRQIVLQLTQAKISILEQNFKTGDVCLPPVQSSVVVGQGGTITCSACNGSGIDSTTEFSCDECLGTGRNVSVLGNLYFDEEALCF